MKKCFRKFNWFSYSRKHSFSITNVFVTLENSNMYDVVKTCQNCGTKEALEMDKQTLKEVIEKFPSAFESNLLEFLISWMR